MFAHAISTDAVQLREDQQDAVKAAREAIDRGIRRFLIELPTGSGKTVTFANWAINDFLALGRRVLVLVHTDELVRQTVAEFYRQDRRLRIGVVKAERDEMGAPLVVASVQSLGQPRRLDRLAADFALVVVDEAHHATAETYLRILRHVGQSDPVISGWTATAFRADEAALVGPVGVFQEVAFALPIAPMIRNGVLCDLTVRRFKLGYDLDEVSRTAGDYAARSLTNVIRAANALPKIVEGYQRELAGRRAIAYTPTLDMADELAEAFRKAGVPAESLNGKTPLDVRRAILGRLRSGATLVVVNPNVLSEGFNEPRVEGILLCRPTTSPVLFRQTIGRGLRPYPGKAVCKILDFAGATKKHDLMDVAKATGVGLKDDETAVEAMIREEVEAEQAAATEAERTRLIAERVDLFQRGQATWAIGKDGRAFSLWIGGRMNLDIVPDPDHPGEDGDERWRVLLASSDSGYRPTGYRRFVPPVDSGLVYGLTLSDANAFADAYARNAGKTAFVNRRERTTPASQAQRALWAKFRKELGPIPDELTVSQASQAIGAVFVAKREQARQSGRRRVQPAAATAIIAAGAGR